MNQAERARIKQRLDALTAADLENIHRDLNASMDLCDVLKEDFRDALTRVADRGVQPGDCRAVVRCFGSLIDALSANMRKAAIEVCTAFGEPLNPFLQDKTAERHLSTHQRIYSIYRLIADFLPQSPLAHLPDSRWDELHRALEIRNRIVHPTCTADLELTKREVAAVVSAGLNFYGDHCRFVQWFSQKEQKMLWDLPGTRRRFIEKTGRNEPCPCGSKRKYKHCCGLSAA